MAINRKALEAKSNEELIALENIMADLNPISELKEVSQAIKEILEERKNNATMKPFTKYDWYDFAGATKFPDGSEPYVGRYDILTVTVDCHGLQAWLEDMEDHIYHSTAPIEFKDVLVATGNLILDVAKQKTADELRAIFRKI